MIIYNFTAALKQLLVVVKLRKGRLSYYRSELRTVQNSGPKAVRAMKEYLLPNSAGSRNERMSTGRRREATRNARMY